MSGDFLEEYKLGKEAAQAGKECGFRCGRASYHPDTFDRERTCHADWRQYEICVIDRLSMRNFISSEVRKDLESWFKTAWSVAFDEANRL